THVSGIVAAKANNNVGIAGVAGYPANAVKIMPLRVLDSQNGGLQGDWANAVYYAADNGADVINMSLASSWESQTLQDAINYAVNVKKVIVIAAAGNSGSKGNLILYPAALDNVVSVGSTTNTDTKTLSSTYNEFVDLSAPGQDIYSTTPTYPHLYSTFYARRGALSYDFRGGTSMATPAVSGVAALIKSKWPAYTPAQIQQVMQNNADDLGDAGRDDYFGYGRLNAGNIFDAPILTSSSPNPTNTAPIPVNFTFSESVEGFESGDVAVGNGAVQNFTGSGTNYTADIIPSSQGEVTVDVPSDVAQDDAGNGNAAADQLTRTYDSLAPSVPGTPSTATPTNDTTPTWSWNASEDDGVGLNSTPYTVQWSKDQFFASGVSSFTSSTNSFTHSQALGEGTWHFRANAKDTLGNTSAYSSNGSVVIDSSIPTVLPAPAPYITPIIIDNIGPKTFAKASGAKTISKKRGIRYKKLYLKYKKSYRKARNSKRKRRYKKLMRRYLKLYQRSRKRTATAKLKVKADDLPSNARSNISIVIKRKVKSKSRAKRKARYRKLYFKNRSFYRKTKNRTLKRRYKRRAGKYKKAYRRIKVFYRKVIKRKNLGWVNSSKWKSYNFRGKQSLYYLYVYASDQAGNKQQNIAKKGFRIR
ncbi:hypothetical protein LCGC14_2025360, partial [marine sediment metagenome]